MISMDALATIINNFRIFPRIMIILYGVIFYQVTIWFMKLIDPTTTQAAFVASVVGAAAAFFGLYVNSGKCK